MKQTAIQIIYMYSGKVILPGMSNFFSPTDIISLEPMVIIIERSKLLAITYQLLLYKAFSSGHAFALYAG